LHFYDCSSNGFLIKIINIDYKIYFRLYILKTILFKVYIKNYNVYVRAMPAPNFSLLLISARTQMRAKINMAEGKFQENRRLSSSLSAVSALLLSFAASADELSSLVAVLCTKTEKTEKKNL